MSTAADIRRLGFRRWYERQLIESHVYLVTAFLALILLLAGIETLDTLRRSPLSYFIIIGAAAAAGLLCFVAWRRFNVLLVRAELIAGNAQCVRCSAWGKFDVIAEERAADDDPPEAGRPHWLRVKCRQCGNDWKIG